MLDLPATLAKMSQEAAVRVRIGRGSGVEPYWRGYAVALADVQRLLADDDAREAARIAQRDGLLAEVARLTDEHATLVQVAAVAAKARMEALNEAARLGDLLGEFVSKWADAGYIVHEDEVRRCEFCAMEEDRSAPAVVLYPHAADCLVTRARAALA